MSAVFGGLLLLQIVALPLAGQNQCQPPECTTGGVCVDSLCTGELVPDGEACEEAFEFNDCLTNPRCRRGACRGDPVLDGTPCAGGCGVCLSGICAGDGVPGAACEDGNPCTTNDRCQVLGLGSPSFCLGDFIACEEEDGNPCTLEFCNPANGNCETEPTVSPCTSCERCVATGTGKLDFRCDLVAAGTACDDDNECTGEGTCDGSGSCSSGVPFTPAATNTVFPAATATPVTNATPTFTPRTCVGDCRDDGEVTVDEILTMVNVALGELDASECTAGDVNGDGQVTVEEIILAVNRALNGCPRP